MFLSLLAARPRVQSPFACSFPDVQSEMKRSQCMLLHDGGQLESPWLPAARRCRSRQIARALPSWRQWERAVVACVQHSQSTILQPVAFSPMK